MKDETQKLVSADKNFIWHPFTQMSAWLTSEPVVIDAGEGFYLIDTEGRRYIDGVSSLCAMFTGIEFRILIMQSANS